MVTKRQHYVPQVYMKAWETEVEKITRPDEKFKGVYEFKENDGKWDGAKRDSILWMSHLYTIEFNFIFLTKSCLKVNNDFINQIYELMKNNPRKPVYGVIKHSKVKSKESIRKHINDIDEWDFYFEDGNSASKKKILSQIYALRCFLLEDAFSYCFETRWESIYKRFIEEVHKGTSDGIVRSEKRIAVDTAIDMLDFAFMMLCRSPQFNAMGIYSKIKENILYSFLGEKEITDEFMKKIWYSELYKMFFKKSGGFYHGLIEKTIEGCQMILFETSTNAGTFITSDNPAFQHFSVVERENKNGIIFPLTPKYLLFILNGKSNSIDVVEHQFANRNTVKQFNKIVQSHKESTLISSERTLNI